MKGDELTIEDARKQLAEYIEYYLNVREYSIEESTDRALEDMEYLKDWHLVCGDAIDGG